MSLAGSCATLVVMSGDKAPVIAGQRVRLRPYEDRDAQVRARFGRNRQIVRALGGDLPCDLPLDPADAAQQLTRRFGPGPHWIIADANNDFLGVARLAPLDAANRSAAYAIAIYDPTRLGSGLGTEVTLLVLAHAFEDLRLHRVSLTVLADNTRAITCYERCGFTTEGRLRHTIWQDDQWGDDLVMAILNPRDEQ